MPRLFIKGVGRLRAFAPAMLACALLAAAPNAAAFQEPSNAATVAAPLDDAGLRKLPDVLATIDGIPITARELETQFRPLAEVQKTVREAREAEVNLQINSRLLNGEAKRRGVTATLLLEQEVVAKVTPPTEADAMAFFEANKARIGGEFQVVKDRIVEHLRNERERKLAQALADRLRAAAMVEVRVQKATPPQTPADRQRVFAVVDGQQITSADVEEALAGLVYGAEKQLYSRRKQELEVAINDRLLEREAKKRNVSVRDLLAAEVKPKPVTEAQAKAFYDENKARINGTFEQVKAQVIQYLQEQEQQKAQLAFADRLRSASTIRIFLTPPEPPVFRIATDDQPSLGEAAAPVTVVAFIDFQSDANAQTLSSLVELVKQSPGRVRLVVRDFPLEQHADAMAAAVAAEAARQQGKYWEFVSHLLRNPAMLGAEKLKEYATQAGLDRQKFDAALQSDGLADKVRQDIQEGGRLGVVAVPSVYINGKLLEDGLSPASIRAAVAAAAGQAK